MAKRMLYITVVKEKMDVNMHDAAVKVLEEQYINARTHKKRMK